MNIRDHMTIRLAATPYKYPAVREADAFSQLGMSAPIFHRHVSVLLDRPDVLAAYPVEVSRLRRLREARRQARAA